MERRGQADELMLTGEGLDVWGFVAVLRKLTLVGGTDVALETADATVLHGRVADVFAMVDLSKRTMANMRQNIAISLGLRQSLSPQRSPAGPACGPPFAPTPAQPFSSR